MHYFLIELQGVVFIECLTLLQYTFNSELVNVYTPSPFFNHGHAIPIIMTPMHIFFFFFGMKFYLFPPFFPNLSFFHLIHAEILADISILITYLSDIVPSVLQNLTSSETKPRCSCARRLPPQPAAYIFCCSPD